MIKAIIFDFDGLMMETEVAVYQAFQATFQAYGGDLPLSVWVETVGSSDTFDPFAYLESQISRPLDRDAARAEYRERLYKLVEAETILPGVQDYLQDAKELGLKIAVASSSPREWVVGHLARHQLDVHFDCIRCSDDVKRTKPDPELFLSALDALEVRAEQTIVLEDSPNGVLAAKRAGLFCVVVPGPLTRDMALEEADLRLSSLEEMPLREVLRHAEERLRTSVDG
jgi:HAD superfamily hydrolase (TIGR01509 family)